MSLAGGRDVAPGSGLLVLGIGATGSAEVVTSTSLSESEELVESGEKISRSKDDCERTSSSSAEAASETPVDGDREAGCSIGLRGSWGGAGNGSRGWMAERLGVDWECEPSL